MSRPDPPWLHAVVAAAVDPSSLSLLLLDGASSMAQFSDKPIGATSLLLIWIQPPARPHHRFLCRSISSISLCSPFPTRARRLEVTAAATQSSPPAIGNYLNGQ
ncbi:Os04g0205400 [Oryza sativa Japonica Group]|uniref:Os04g0205400 protein n=1 Tax=Oryza sativa subsp. japonica TaxID=39947 RepID=A0A0P0W7G7_ORYSJ|nr:Os04g0205400 [Oryza sativa Japonica Group]